MRMSHESLSAPVVRGPVVKSDASDQCSNANTTGTDYRSGRGTATASLIACSRAGDVHDDMLCRMGWAAPIVGWPLPCITGSVVHTPS